MSENAKPNGPYNFSVKADNLNNATLEAVAELCRIGFVGMYSDVWDGKIKNPEGEDYEILRGGSWLVDFETGEKLPDLEEKLD